MRDRCHGFLEGLWHFAVWPITALLFLFLALDPGVARTETASLSDRLPSDVPTANVTGNWQFIPVPLPDRNVTHILVSKAGDRLYLGTPGGVASYDGVKASTPSFETADAEQSIYVNSLVELAGGVILVGTINDSFWLWKGDEIRAIYGACPPSTGFCARGDWAFAKSEDGLLYVASSSFGPSDPEALDALKSSVSEHIAPVQVSASFLGFAGPMLVATSQSGAISIIDLTSRKPSRTIDLQIERNSFVRNVSYAAGLVLIGTDSGCFEVGLENGSTPAKLAEGNCSAVSVQRDGTVWLSTDVLYRHDRQGWQRWSPGQSGAISASAVVGDDMSNVWIGTATGLWRYFDLSRDYSFPGENSEISSMVGAKDGGVVVGLRTGEVWRLNRALESSRLVPADEHPPGSPYYRGAILAIDNSDKLWALSAAGLFRFDGGTSTKVADFPSAIFGTQSFPSSLAVSAEGTVCTGLIWSEEAICLSNGAWHSAIKVSPEIGGSAVSAVTFTGDGTLLAVGVQSVAMGGSAPVEIGPFPPMPFGKKHLFGAIAKTTLVADADFVASGGWGGTVFLKRTLDGISDVGHGGKTTQDQPYVIRQLAPHVRLGLLAAADEGLFLWQGSPSRGRWESLREIDPRLAAGIDGVVPSTERGFWISSGSRLSLINLPTAAPQVEIKRTPTGETIDVNSVVYHIAIPGLVGLPSSKMATITYDPIIPNAEIRINGPEDRLDLSGLTDLTNYRLSAAATDNFLNTGPASISDFSVRLPFYQNPYKLGGAVLAGIAALGLLLSRRGPTGFLLLRLGGLKWSTEKSDARFAIQVQPLNPDLIRYELEAPSELTLIRLAVDVAAPQLEGTPKEILPRLVSIAQGQLQVPADEFEFVMARASERLGEEALPESLRFATSQVKGGAIAINLSKSLLWLPLELADDGGGDQLLLRFAIGRTVSGDILAEAPTLRATRLTVAVFAPHIDASAPQLPQIESEVQSVAAAARKWGADVRVVRPDASKQEVLDALCSANLFHYAGHAEFVPESAGQSYLPVRGDRIFAQEVASALQSKGHNLLLAFINGCGSSREANWDRGSDVYGFASAFLNNAAYFIGAQWPIHDEFAALMATDFYTRLFPQSYSLWWRLARRDPLHGLAFAEALRAARHTVLARGPAGIQTWSSYVFYGDPTQRLVLR